MTVDTQTPPRQSDHAIDSHILERWSPRAFDASALDEGLLLTALEGARWAPSAFNHQPWRFFYELRDGPHWQDFVSILLPFNAAWAADASALVFIVSDTVITNPGKADTPATTASFDTGAAWGLFALQAAKLGLHTHAMAGFDHARASQILHLEDRHRVEAAVAIGRLGSPDQLPDKLRAREFPSPRRPLAESARRGPHAS